LNFNGLENAENTDDKRSFSIVRFIFKTIAWLFIILIISVGIAVCLVFAYENEVKGAIVKELNKNLKSEVKIDPANIDLTIIKTFPKCALEFKQVLILEALKKKNRDTLIYADNITMQFSLKDLFNKNYTIKKVTINGAKCNLHVTKSGEPNYIFWKKSEGRSNDSLKFALEDISLTDVNLIYKNSRQKIKAAFYIDRSGFAGAFNDAQQDMQTAGKAKLKYLQVNKSTLLKNKNIHYDFDFSINGNKYEINKAELSLNEMLFDIEGTLNYGDSLEMASLQYNGKSLDIASVLSLLPETYSNKINDYSSDGDFYAKGSMNYRAGKPFNFNSEFGINNATITYKPLGTKLQRLNVTGKAGSNNNESYLNVQNISAELGSNTFNGNCLITNFNDPYITLNANVKTMLEELNKFWPIDTVEYLSGSVDLVANIKGSLNEMKQSAFSPNITANGKANLKDIKTKLKGSPNEININSGSFVLDNRNVSVSNFDMQIGKSNIQLTGELPEFLNYMFDSKSPLIINASLKSNNLALEDILYGDSNSSGKVEISDNLRFNINADIEKFSFAKFEAEQVKGSVAVNDQKVVVKELLLKAMDGEGKVNAFADASGKDIRITANANFRNINISKLFYQLNNFGQNTLNDKHLKGFATADIDFSGNWSKELKADLKSIEVTSTILIERGELMNFKPLESLSKYVEVQELRDVKFASLQSNIEIKDQVIIIPKTVIKNSAINMELWGKHTFNNEIDYHFKLLLSELIASRKRANKQLDEELAAVEKDLENKRCVFVVMTGTVDDPVIKYDRKGLKQKIKEDIKEEKQNLKSLLKEEFGLFKKDSTPNKKEAKAQEKFNIEFGEKKETKPKNNLQPKKKEEDDGDF
jgi:hypothetical protein